MIPEFTLSDQDGVNFSSHENIGKKNLVLFFLPQDGLPISIFEALAFKDAYPEFVENDFEVIGISSDTSSTHLLFKKEYSLPYRLLSDEHSDIRKLLKIPNSFMYLVPIRVTVVIDKQGIVRKIFNSTLSHSSHIREAIGIIKKG